MFDEELEQFSIFPQLVFGVDRLGDVGTDAEDPDNLAVGGFERVLAVIDPAMRAVKELQALDLVRGVSLGQDLLVSRIKHVGVGLGIEVIPCLACEVHFSVVVCNEIRHSAGGAHERVIAVLEIHVIVCVIQQCSEAVRDGFESRVRFGLCGLESEAENHLPGFFAMLFCETCMNRADPAIGVADAQVCGAGGIQ